MDPRQEALGLLMGPDRAATYLQTRGEPRLAWSLFERASELCRYRGVLGDDHPHTLISANNLAADLSAAGEHERVRELEGWIREQREQ